MHSRDRRVERDGRGDALTHARRQTRHAWVVLAAALQPGRGALRSSSSSSLSPVGVLVSRRLFGRRSVRSKRAARLHRDGGRARDARRGWFSPPQSSRAVRARRGGLLLLLFSRPVAGRRPRLAPSLRPPLRAEQASGALASRRGTRARRSPWVRGASSGSILIGKITIFKKGAQKWAYLGFLGYLWFHLGFLEAGVSVWFRVVSQSNQANHQGPRATPPSYFASPNGHLDGRNRWRRPAGKHRRRSGRICEQKTPNSPHNTAPHVASQCAATTGTHNATRPQHATPRGNTAPRQQQDEAGPAILTRPRLVLNPRSTNPPGAPHCTTALTLKRGLLRGHHHSLTISPHRSRPTR